jgi:RimJ/RimL family protein N-acetyltransferase
MAGCSLYPSFTKETTALCPFNDETHLLFERWFSDQELVALMGDWEFYPLPYYGQTAAEFVARARKTSWLVCHLSEGHLLPIGYTGLYLQPRHRVGILRLAIAEAAYRRSGHGYRAMQMVLEWSFRSLDLFSLHASLSASNKPVMNLVIKCGFRKCGQYALSRYEPSGRFDEIHVELLQKDWFGLRDEEPVQSAKQGDDSR